MTISIALDLGTTRIKAAVLNDDGQLGEVTSEAAPAVNGEDPIRESDPRDYLRIATDVLARAAEGVAKGTSLGIATQRSTFVLWEKESGAPVTPLISWQDRRSAPWCEERQYLNRMVSGLTGLMLTPYYAATKLAYVFDEDQELRRRAEAGELLLGSLDTYLVWHWSQGAAHQQDVTLAARTLLADAHTGGWSAQLLQAFDIPPPILPAIVDTVSQDVSLENGLTLMSTIGDQQAGALCMVGESPSSMLVNLGTGGFVLHPLGDRFQRKDGYLCNPLLGHPEEHITYTLEGTINGGSNPVDRLDEPPAVLPDQDPTPDAFCIPDAAGLGAPYWRSDIALTWSDAAEDLPDADKRRIVLEGIVFRVRGIVEDLSDKEGLGVMLSGGLSRDPFVAQALASCLHVPVLQCEEPEATLLGAARLAAGMDPFADAKSIRIEPSASGNYLSEKYERWKTWLQNILV